MEIKINHLAGTNRCDEPAGMGDGVVGNIGFGYDYKYRPENNLPGWPPAGDYPFPHDPFNPWKTGEIEDHVRRITDSYQNNMYALPACSKITQVDSNTRMIEVKVPGYKPEEVSITVNGNMLEIKASTSHKGFYDSISIAQELSRNENVESADLENGMLTIMLKSKGEKSKKIPIKTK